MAIDSDGGGGGAKRQRVDDRGVRREAVGADSPSADRISALPDELRQRILTRVSLKDAIRTGVLARGWRDLWKSRWPHPASVEVHLTSRDTPQRMLDALVREPRRRLDRFSLVVNTSKLRHSELRGFTDYAAECRVEDLHVKLLKTVKRTLKGKGLRFYLPLSSPLLARLSLRGIGVLSRIYYKGAQPFRALEVIRLHSVSITQVGFANMMALCPSLLTLDLRRCNCYYFFYEPESDSKRKTRNLVMPPNLRTITVADCESCASLNLVPVPSLRSFCYRGNFANALFSLPGDASLVDLYICIVGERPFVYSDLSRHLPIDLSGLTVLTICNNVLEIAPSLLNEAWPNLSNLQSLKELQLILSGMNAKTLANIYVFLRASHCHNLERLFVQLPDIDHWCPEYLVQGEQNEPPEDGLGNLRMVKVMNFNWHIFEVQLVSSLLRKASSLHKLLLVSPNITFQHMPGVLEADLSLLKEALANGRMILSESDDPATQPFHSEVFIKV